jgi:hypothetical protein
MPNLKKTGQAVKPRTVKAPQSIVHIKHVITLQQYKLWVQLLQTYRLAFERGEPPDADGQHTLRLSEFYELIGYEYQQAKLEADLRALRREEIALSYLEKGGEKVKEFIGFIGEIRLTAKTLRFQLPSTIRRAMEGLDQPGAMFQLINWEIFNRFTGKHEAIIYKLARDYVGTGSTPYFTLEEFRDYMGLKAGEYEDFKTLNRRVISDPLKRINEADFSDITVSVEFEKKGRFVVGLRFKVHRKKQTQLHFHELEESPVFAFAKVRIPLTRQTEFLALRAPEEIEACIARGNEYGEELTRKGKKPDYGAIYAKAITDGWHVDFMAKKADEEAQDADRRKSEEAEASKLAEVEENERIERAESARLWEAFKAMSEDEQRPILDRAIEGNEFVRVQFLSKGLDSRMVRACVLKAMREGLKEDV